MCAERISTSSPAPTSSAADTRMRIAMAVASPWEPPMSERS